MRRPLRGSAAPVAVPHPERRLDALIQHDAAPAPPDEPIGDRVDVRVRGERDAAEPERAFDRVRRAD